MTLNDIIDIFVYKIGNDIGSTGEILFMLFMTLALALYEFVIYRVVSHRSMYNKSLHTLIMIIPFFIAAIIMALQSNLVITLGTIGALAIIRFRTAIKDPIDMLYILWSVFVGITCGCEFYKLCVLTSLLVTIVLVCINLLGNRLLKNPYVLVLNCDDDIEQQLTDAVKVNSRRFRVKSRNYTASGYDFIYQVETSDVSKLKDSIKDIEGIRNFSLLEYDNEDVI